MVIVDYTDIITLARAKNYLRIDDGLTADDDEITSMINAAFLFMERYTNYVFKPKDFIHNKYEHDRLFNPKFKIYNFPINTFTQSNSERFIYPLYSVFKTNTDVNFTYNAGYINSEDVPNDFIQSALQIIKVWYFEAQKQQNDQIIPMATKQVLDTYRRFV